MVFCWQVPLNALTLVNLAMGLGIAVEFQAHLLHAFLVLDPAASRTDRAQAALVDVGASVLSGITLTKFAGERRSLTHNRNGICGSTCICFDKHLIFTKESDLDTIWQ